MNLFKMNLLSLLFLFSGLVVSAQPADKANCQPPMPRCQAAAEAPHSTFAAILYNGEMMGNEASFDHMAFNPNSTGMLSVYTISGEDGISKPDKQIGFKIAVKNSKTNTVWMYTDQTLFEVNLKQVMNQCDMGDTLIFMTLDRKYRLPRNQIVVMDGC